MRRTVLLLLLSASLAAAAPGQVLKIEIDGDINPLAAHFIIDGVRRAQSGDYEALLIQMDTPGGLLQATQTIVKTILDSDVPVIMYIAPSGAGAVSAGVFITIACHIAAMAEGTNIGAAHPVGLGGKEDSSKVMGEKVENYAAAWARGIAEKRGRNADWVENAFKRSVSVTEKEALRLNVIDLVAPTEDSLLKAIDGRTVELRNGRQKTLATRNAEVIERRMNWSNRILYRISNPTIAYILLMLGIYGLFFELSNPGAIIPGVAGGISIVLAFMALQTLPVSTAGILLILFALVLFILEIKVTSYGILTIGGIIAMFLGSLMLFQETPGFAVRVDWRVALTFAVFTGAFFIFALGMALKTRMTKPTTGKEGLIGEIGTALTAIPAGGEGDVRVWGEIWHAGADTDIAEGEAVRVVAVNGLRMRVEKVNSLENKKEA